jgi:hypothetical protein
MRPSRRQCGVAPLVMKKRWKSVVGSVGTAHPPSHVPPNVLFWNALDGNALSSKPAGGGGASNGVICSIRLGATPIMKDCAANSLNVPDLTVVWK